MDSSSWEYGEGRGLGRGVVSGWMHHGLMSDRFGWSGGFSFYQSAFRVLRVNSHRKSFLEMEVLSESGRVERKKT